LWGFCGNLARAGASCVMAIPSLPALSQVRRLTMEAQAGSRDRTRTYNLPVNRRSVRAGDRRYL
jgi:hypothetical protein